MPTVRIIKNLKEEKGAQKEETEDGRESDYSDSDDEAAYNQVDEGSDVDEDEGAEQGADPGGSEVWLLPSAFSHLPPTVELVSGVGVEDVAFVKDALHALFYTERDASRDGDEPAEGVVHKWSEWLKEEWIATKGGA